MRSISVVRFTFLITAGVLFASLAVTYFVGRETISRSTEISLREASIRQVEEVFSTLQDTEIGQRGFLLTGREEYLAPYNDARQDLPARLRHLQNAAMRGEVSAAPVKRLEQLSNEKLAELAQSIERARKDGSQAAMAIVLSDTGLKKMDGIRAVFGQILDEEEAQLASTEETLRKLVGVRTWVFVIAALVNLAFLVWAYRRIRREMTRRYVADLESQRQKETFAVSLASIGDAVILADTDARIIFMNEVAEGLTGWSLAQAKGRLCSEVFRIINESSRVPVESPVDRVLRTGKIVGLANHTLLIRKDGSEVPIDDSGAPIREQDGTVRGVVLVFRDFSEHKNSERELREVSDRLEVANKAKDNFMAALSHELRTPLTPVLGTLSNWESSTMLPEPFAADVRMLSRNVRLEVRLIDDLLDLTRISRGHIELHKERVDVHALIAAVVEIFRADADARQVRIGLRVVASRHFVDGDPARLQQVFWNILGNALKHTPVGGRIEIVTANDGDDLRITFADNGRGMSAETLKHLFHPFERASDGPGYHRGGLGIGLTISQNLAQAHGGEIEARSEGPDLGATFVVRVPVLADSSAAPTGKPGEVQAGVSGHALSILLVEDHHDSAMVIGRIVRNMGHAVVVSHNMTDALVELREQKFDLVLSDIGLPDGTGIELLEKTRTFSKVPMIALTGYGMDDDLVKYRQTGFLHQLTKPIRFEQLEKLLRDFAASHGQSAK